MEYIDRKDTHLKWHRLMQFIGWPVLILLNGAIIATCVCALLNVKLPWPTTPLTAVQQFITTLSKGAVTPLLTSIMIIVLALIFLVLQFYSWIGAFKWRRYSQRSWIVCIVLSFLLVCGLAALMELVVIPGSGLSVLLGQQIAAGVLRSRVILLIRIAMYAVVFAVGLIHYLNFLYYHKRRKLYVSDDYYEDDSVQEYGRPEVTSPIQPLPAETPKPAPTPAPAPAATPQEAQETIVLELPDQQPQRNVSANFLDADNDGVPDSPDNTVIR